MLFVETKLIRIDRSKWINPFSRGACAEHKVDTQLNFELNGAWAALSLYRFQPLRTHTQYQQQKQQTQYRKHHQTPKGVRVRQQEDLNDEVFYFRSIMIGVMMCIYINISFTHIYTHIFFVCWCLYV